MLTALLDHAERLLGLPRSRVGEIEALTGAILHRLSRIVAKWPQDAQEKPREYILELLTLHTRGVETSSKWDLFYGVKALTGDLGGSSLDPNYNISLSELWRRVTVALLSIRSDEPVGPAAVLALAGTQPDAHSFGLPSWIIDVEKLNNDSIFKAAFYRDYSERHRAGGSSTSLSVQFSREHADIIQLSGIISCQVETTLKDSQWPCVGARSGKTTNEDFTREFTYCLLPWYLKCFHFALDKNRACTNIMDTFGSLLVHGADFEGIHYPIRPESHLDRICERALRLARKHDSSLIDVQVDIRRIAHDIFPFINRDWYHLEQDATRVLAVTTDGRLAWVPGLTQVGDDVCLFQGAPFPFVLRHVDNGYRRIVGDAYVHGISHGEAWPRNDKDIDTISLN